MREGLKIGPRILRSPCTRFGGTMCTEGIELCLCVIRKREIWEVGFHCASLAQMRRREIGVRVEQESMEILTSALVTKNACYTSGKILGHLFSSSLL